MKLGQIIFTGKTKKGKNIIIRYPNDKDTQVLLDYINTLSKEQTFIRFQGEQQTLQEEEKYMKNYLEKITKNKAVKILAFIDEKLVGVSDISLQDKTSAHVGTFGITVAQGYRGEGIGKLLMKLVVEESEKNIKNLRVITLGCFANNKTACAMYTKFGFKEYGKLPGGIKHKGEFVDHIYFYKNLE